MNLEEVLTLLKQKSNADHLSGMKRFGIEDKNALGIPMPELRKLAKVIEKNHLLASKLWETGIHEARILASMIDNPAQVTAEQIDNWTKDFDSWDVCDQVCGNLFDRTPFAIEKAFELAPTKKNL